MYYSARESFRFDKQPSNKYDNKTANKSENQQGQKQSFKTTFLKKLRIKDPQESFQESASCASFLQPLNTCSTNQTTINTETIQEEDENLQQISLQKIRIKKQELFKELVGYQSPSEAIQQSFGRHPIIETPKELKRAQKLSIKVKKYQNLFFDRNLNSQAQIRNNLTPRTINKILQKKNKFKPAQNQDSERKQAINHNNIYFIPVEYLSPEGYGFQKFTKQHLSSKLKCDYNLSKNMKKNLIRKIAEQYFN